MAITVEQVERIAEKLRALPPIENKKRVVSKQESIKMLTSEIAGLRERGYTLEQIAELLTADQLEIGAPTLKSYLQRSKGAKKKPTKSTTKPPSKPSQEAAAVQQRGSIATKAAASLGASVDAAPTSGTMTVRPDRAQI